MSDEKTKNYNMTPENFGVLFRAVSMLNDEPDFRLYKVQACPGNRVAFSIILADILALGHAHEHDPAIVIGMSKIPEEAMQIAIEKGKRLLARIEEPVDHPFFSGFAKA